MIFANCCIKILQLPKCTWVSSVSEKHVQCIFVFEIAVIITNVKQFLLFHDVFEFILHFSVGPPFLYDLPFLFFHPLNGVWIQHCKLWSMAFSNIIAVPFISPIKHRQCCVKKNTLWVSPLYIKLLGFLVVERLWGTKKREKYTAWNSILSSWYGWSQRSGKILTTYLNSAMLFVPKNSTLGRRFSPVG